MLEADHSVNTKAANTLDVTIDIPEIEEHPLKDQAFSLPRTWQRFWRTHRMIKNNEPLYDYSKIKLEEAKVMGPWKFNLTETVMASTPSVVVGQILFFFWPAIVVLPPEATALTKEYVNQYPTVAGFLQPFLVPALLTMTSGIVARATLQKADVSKSTKRRARYAFLYFDGTYGLVPQTCASMCIMLLVWMATAQKWNGYCAIAIGLVFLYATLHLMYLQFDKVPKLIFQVNGYATKVVRFWTRKCNRPSNPAPWSRYSLRLLLLGGIVGWGMIITFQLVVMALAYALAFAKLSVGG